MKKSLDAILDDFAASAVSLDPKSRAPLTLWLSPAYKERYDQLQKRSGKLFCRKLQELVMAAIDRCEPESQAS